MIFVKLNCSHFILLQAEASEPTVDGPQKFTLTSKGHKHTFKAANSAERDNWVAQLKLKIAEAKELATTVTESETYKKTIEGFKPTPPPKEEKKVEAAPAAAVEAPKTEETPVVAAAAPGVEPKTEETPAPKKEEKERRSASRKRGSIFGNLLNKPKEEKAKVEEKKEEKKEEKAAETAAPAEATATVPATTEAPVAVETAAVPVESAAAPVETAPVEEAKTETKTESAKPAPTKRSRYVFTIEILALRLPLTLSQHLRCLRQEGEEG